ncbi:hypothetical protein FNV62_31995 [Streptomyces sp. RLB3-17]|jgi:hypothetical protein|uniref:hypothetical protein n=1 Tax=Streptomyces TaxID=1883 RepID=UPI0009C806A9|nr:MULTISPECIES: hypothetical protein [Streptomyces]NMI60498.1 hypothetical protein [Streptomyces sp. RLA2-12]QDN59655.1 hypothetical protein FNV67_34180 [Streptomyces sp. S1D4-20]QDN69732.1 hypothetical protein FNV66_33200 [Streptomyces sp. S1D4-14]QDN89724.1 hypothetical protein FNV61_32935 [Streptomyces sp. RLB3-6]QDO00354.1 hypothetical protein FNV58_34260 [Streptomyces sp. RLB1-9]
MTHPEALEYSNFAGARMLLEPYYGWSRRIPDEPSEWQKKLFPLIRGIRTAERDGGRNLREIATELRLAAELFEEFPGGSHKALNRIPCAETEERTSEVLREIARHLEDWNADWRRYGETPMDVWELGLRFPRFSQILPIYFGQDGMAISDDMQDATVEEGICMYIDQTHPRCPWYLPSVVAECYQALALFHTEHQMDRFFSHAAMAGGSGSEDFLDFFPLFARLCIEHLKEAHSPLWEPEQN